MSLYNVLFGVNDDAPVLLGMLSVNMEYFGRFRDVYLADNGNVIRVYTRLGGGNRENYKEIWDKIKKHKFYLKDFDDSFDETYAYIDFKIPNEYIFTASKMYVKEPKTVSEMFEKECEEMEDENSDAYKRAEKIAILLMNGIENGGGIINL